MDSPPPTPSPKTSRNTLIKECTVMAIVLGVLMMAVSVILPMFGSASPNARLTTSSLNASGIGKALYLYAYDHDGRFPESLSNSNQAFRQLFPDYLEDEKVFFVPGSAWHGAAPNRRPDDDIGIKPDYAQCLQKGENHWAYVSGLSTSSPPDAPLIADGFMEGQPGSYTDNPKKKGGVWKGKYAIVISVSGAAERIKLSKETGFRVLREKGNTGQKIDIFTREGGLPETATVLNPE